MSRTGPTGWPTPAHWAARTEAVEERLSDALHARLTERFVDRRTSILMRAVGNDPDLIDVEIDDDGAVAVEGEVIGRIDAFAFAVDPAARGSDRKRLIAAAERHLARERNRRATALIAASDGAFRVDATRHPPMLQWLGADVATLVAGRAVAPDVRGTRALDTLDAVPRAAVLARLSAWLDGQLARCLGPLRDMEAARRSATTPAPVRAILAPLVEGGGIVARATVEAALAALDSGQRRALTRSGLTIGTLDLFDARLLKPGALFWAAVVRTVRTGQPVTIGPRPGATIFVSPDGADPVHGYRRFGRTLVRIDLIERVARATHDMRQARVAFVPDTALATSFGIDAATLALVLSALGFRAVDDGQWVWGTRPRPPRSTRPAPTNAFAALETLRLG